MADKLVSIQSIIVKLGNKEIELTIDEAREFKNELERLLGVDKYQYWYIQPQPTYPPYIQPFVPYIVPNKPLEYEVTWNTTRTNTNKLPVSGYIEYAQAIS